MVHFHALKRISVLAVMGMLLILTGCEGIVGTSTPTEFYRLTRVDLADKSFANALGSDLQIGVGPISIPGYADRPQIVTGGPGGLLIVDDLHHWAEPVHDNIERVLVADVASLLSERQVFHYPTNFTPAQDSLQIDVQINEMIRGGDGKVQLAVTWNIKSLLDNRLIRRDSVNYISQSSAADFAQLSDILSDLLGQLAVDMLNSVAQSR
mgnify:CR=1 FL=1